MAAKQVYEHGYSDGLEWDLSEYASREELAATRGKWGWLTATVAAVGAVDLAAQWGCPAEGDRWERACEEYDRGCLAGALDQFQGAGPRAGL